jgi:hypothetical protein
VLPQVRFQQFADVLVIVNDEDVIGLLHGYPRSSPLGERIAH